MSTGISLRLKLVALLGSLVFASIAIVVWVQSAQAFKLAKETAIAGAQETASHYAGIVASDFNTAMDTANALASVFEGLKNNKTTSRKIYNDILRQTLQTSNTISAVWTCWEPNALDDNDDAYADTPGYDKTGRFIPYWHRTESGVKLEPLVDYDKPGTGDYYQVPFREGKPGMIEPYRYKIGEKEVFMTSLAVPIHFQDKVVGVVGVDIRLERFQSWILTLAPMQTGWAVLNSSKGVCIAHKNPERIGKNVITGFGDNKERQLAFQKAAQRQTHAYIENDKERKERISKSYSPVMVNGSDTPWVMNVNIPEGTILARPRAMVRTSVLIGLCACFVSVLLGFIFVNGIVRQVRNTSDALQDIAQGEGDLTKRLAIRTRDEIGQLASWFNTFLDKLQRTIRDIDSNTDTLSSASGKMSATSTELEGSTESMNRETKAAASAGEQLSITIDSISTTARQLSSSSASVAASIEQMTTSINEVARNCDQESRVAADASQKAISTREVMSQLGTAAREINKVVEVISNIADQTNLLALNATIEAASAGEAGKGFAVVANEVKELARQSAQATQQIARQVEAVQASTLTSVKAIEDITTTIETVSQIARSIAAAMEQQAATVSEVAKAVSDVSTASSSLSSGVETAATSARTVSQSIQGVTGVAEQVALASRTTNENAQALALMATTLKQLVRQFKV